MKPSDSAAAAASPASASLWARFKSRLSAKVAAAAAVPAVNVIVDDALFHKQEAVYRSLVITRRSQWVLRIGIRVCFLGVSRLLAFLSPWIATFPEGWNDVGSLVLITLQALCVLFGFWSWTDRIFAPLIHASARKTFRSQLRKRGHESEGPEFIVNLFSLQMRLNEANIKAQASDHQVQSSSEAMPSAGSAV